MSSPRFAFLDALRGVACLAVLGYHLLYSTPLQAALRHTLPAPLLWLPEVGRWGVQVFFVISGFVIAHSTSELPLRRGPVLNFILRRQVRLDPAYWVALALALASLVAERSVSGSHSLALPTVPALLLNLVYLQGLAGLPPILGVAWTLCVEVQFYLAWVLLLGALKDTRHRPRRSAGGLLLALGVASLLCAHAPFTLFLRHWAYFALGALLYWLHRGWVGVALPLLLSLGCLVQALVTGHLSAVVGGLTGLLLLGCLARGGLCTWGRGRVVQYFGRISYSLYLCHTTLLLAVMRVGYRITHENGVAAVLWAAVAGGVCIGAAHLLWLWVERPSVEWARRLKPA